MNGAIISILGSALNNALQTSFILALLFLAVPDSWAAVVAQR